VYSSPKSGTAAAATAPARLAEEFDGQALWRTAPDGTTEVVTLRGGKLERHRVNDDGTTTLVGSSDYSLGRRLGFLALAVGAVLFVGGGLAAERDPRMAVVVVAGWLLWLAGIVALGVSQDLGSRARRAYGGKGKWHMPTSLRNWTPRTTEQLAAVERIADEHGGGAFVSDVGGRTVDVIAARRGRVERYWVDEDGRTELAERNEHRASYLADRLLKGAALLLFFGLIAVGFGVEEHKGLLIASVLATLAMVMVLGWRNDPEARLERRLRRGGDGRHWIELRTKEDDGGD
jgi:hypothetical protein